jgi:signal recognition particle GTPase
MGNYDRLDIFMKMLEVIEKDVDPAAKEISPADRGKVTTIIQKLEGNLSIYRFEDEVHMSGDSFENVSNSVIATRGSIAKGVIAIRTRGKPDVADAIETLTDALATSDVPQSAREESLELLQELTSQAAATKPSKIVLKSLGASLLSAIEGIGSIADVLSKTWPLIASMWA